MAQDLMPKRPGIWPLWDKIKFMFIIALPRIGIIFRNRASVVDPRATAVSILRFFFVYTATLISTQFVKKVREQRKYDKIGAVGYVSFERVIPYYLGNYKRYCFGGSLGVRLAPLNIFDSLVICHPGRVSEAEVKGINVGLLHDSFSW
jgi:hypothetical protein